MDALLEAASHDPGAVLVDSDADSEPTRRTPSPTRPSDAAATASPTAHSTAGTDTPSGTAGGPDETHASAAEAETKAAAAANHTPYLDVALTGYHPEANRIVYHIRTRVSLLRAQLKRRTEKKRVGQRSRETNTGAGKLGTRRKEKNTEAETETDRETRRRERGRESSPQDMKDAMEGEGSWPVSRRIRPIEPGP